MNNILQEKYKEVKLNEQQVEMFADIVRFSLEMKTVNNESITEAVFKEIAKSTYDKDLNPNANGITKAELQSKIKVFTKKKIGNSYEDTIGNLSRKICDDCISILMGASLIYQDKKIQATTRGLQVVAYFKKHSVKMKNK